MVAEVYTSALRASDADDEIVEVAYMPLRQMADSSVVEGSSLAATERGQLFTRVRMPGTARAE